MGTVIGCIRVEQFGNLPPIPSQNSIPSKCERYVEMMSCDADAVLGKECRGELLLLTVLQWLALKSEDGRRITRRTDVKNLARLLLS